MVLARDTVATNNLGLDSTLTDLAYTLHAKAFCKELRKLNDVTSGPQNALMVGTS